MPFITTPREKIEKQPCYNQQHNPPTMMVLPPGKHVWKCPSCGKETVIHIPLIRC